MSSNGKKKEVDLPVFPDHIITFFWPHSSGINSFKRGTYSLALGKITAMLNSEYA